MTPEISNINTAIEPIRQRIVDHEIYGIMHSPDDVKIFMRYHIYAVWDFMSLLKSLQSSLTCTSVPWFPTGSADTRYLINEIVAGEESDVDLDGNRKSHFELYLDAMQQCGADTNEINRFLETLKKTGNLQQAFDAAGTPTEAREFVSHTFEVINTGKNHIRSAVFTFGREDLIPGMFISMVRDLDANFPNSLSIFKYYLERHIEVDGDHHSNLALQMTAELCQDSTDWEEAEKSVAESLEIRLKLWDGAYAEICRQTQTA